MMGQVGHTKCLYVKRLMLTVNCQLTAANLTEIQLHGLGITCVCDQSRYKCYVLQISAARLAFFG